MGRVLTFGELLLRISPDSDSTWLKENKVLFYPGGAEANVASALGIWGIPVSYLTALPNNFITRQLANHFTKIGIDVSLFKYEGNRLGLYYLSEGKDLKNAEVIYDREGSSFAQIKPKSIDWLKIFEGVSWFHFSAICPALNAIAAEVCLEALKIADELKINISLDLNYRAKLWQYGKDSLEVMPELTKYCTLVMGNIWSIHKMLGIPITVSLEGKSNKEAFLEQARLTSLQLIKEFPKCRTVANTFRLQDSSETRYFGTLLHEKEMFHSNEYHTIEKVHSIGTGDCFMAGLIYGFYQAYNMQEIIDFAAAAAFDKFFSSGDATNSSVEKILARISE